MILAHLTTTKEAKGSRVHVIVDEERKGPRAQAYQTWETMAGTISFIINAGATEELRERKWHYLIYDFKEPLWTKAGVEWMGK